MAAILRNKHYDRPSVFDPANLLQAARRQRALPAGAAPAVCVLDPDGDWFRQLEASGARHNPSWACYHTAMVEFAVDGEAVGVIGGAVGAPFAVLVAEELFASGCRFLISVTSAGQIVAAGEPPYFVLIDRAWRDEGTSYHYLAPAPYARIGAEALALVQAGLGDAVPVVQGGVWTTDAPFRETAEAIAFAQAENLLAVEMEAAALYAFAEAQGRPVVCFARVTNQMGRVANDFEKGEADGNHAFRELVTKVARAWRAQS